MPTDQDRPTVAPMGPTDIRRRRTARRHGAGWTLVGLVAVAALAAAVVVAGAAERHRPTAPGASPSPGSTAAPARRPVAYNTGIVRFVYQGGACGPPSMDTYPRNLCRRPINSVKGRLGFGNRQCGSYVMWMEASTGHEVLPFSVLGHAGHWPEHVPPSWITTDPQPGEAAIRPSTPGLVGETGRPDPGHAMYIVAVDYQGTGDLLVKQYNVGDKGEFSEAVVAPSGTYFGHPYHLVYIDFPLTSA